MQEMVTKFREKIESLTYGRHSISVYGTEKLRCFVQCISRDTANEWAVALSQIAAVLGAKVSVIPTTWEMKDQSSRHGESCLHIQRGYLISFIY